MKSRLKSLLIGGCVGGGVYAAIMAAFDYYDEQEFSLWKFVINFLIFGGSNAFITWYSFKHVDKKQHDK
ncbi:MAG TPA: hypothetical protein DIV44_15600 [Leeuwenhoekiella sp.]|nr:hypothetical protein [Leeuwenhoekiella sp.]MBH11688.1 hypothetical protein [Leeuwenhoekiella sp.]HBO28296.1 hypothetical protein [Leeuwenhoekiella sp.]HCQ78235.1 hypothetical protein [Leeuwenhoekiella sp.]|tara:strand:+ start:799 stop:1005 length:207 start_codon:yes stop_codon:yes gene_type:complete